MKTLKEKLLLRKKNMLMEYARILGIRKISALRKEAIVDKICETLLDSNQLFYRMAILDDYEMQLFNAAITAPVLLNDANESGLIKLCAMNLAIIDMDQCVRVAEDVAHAFKKIDMEKLMPYRKKASWVYKCLKWCEDMYGCYPIDVFTDVINSKKGFHFTTEEAIDVFDHLPPTEVWSYLSDNVFIFSDYISDMDGLNKLISIQADKDYYIPSYHEVEEYCDTDALISDKEYQNLNSFLVNEMEYDKENARDLLLDMWFKNAFEEDFHGTMEWFMGEIVPDREARARKAIDLFMKAHNNTRMLINRGHKPIEIQSRRPIGPGNIPTIMAGSSKAADMLSEIAPDIENMGFSLDLDSNADTMIITHSGNDNATVQKKIYPNDPCPCGSGKKYKKCCGKNK